MKTLSRSELKNIMGGNDDAGASCVMCQCGTMHDCYYSSRDAATVCSEVYPNCAPANFHYSSGVDCVANECDMG